MNHVVPRFLAQFPCSIPGHGLGVFIALGLLTAAMGQPPVQAQAPQQPSSIEAIQQVAPKVVKIFGAGGRKNLVGYGTGFLVSPEGHIVTVWSHILDGDTVTVVLHDGSRHTGSILGAEPRLDLAVLKIDSETPEYFDLKQKVPPASVGTRVLALSNVFKVATGDEPVSVVHGVVSAQSTLAARRGVFEAPYSGPIYVVDSITNNSGAAGGVLVTRDGRLLGMLGKELKNNTTHTWLNYVVPIEQLKTPITEIVTGNFASRLKNDPMELPPDRPRYTPSDFGFVLVPDVIFRTPAYIDRVLPGSLAEKAGLRSDDLVLFVGDQLVQSCRALNDEFQRIESGDRLILVVRRGDQLVTIQLPVPRKAAPE